MLHLIVEPPKMKVEDPLFASWIFLNQTEHPSAKPVIENIQCLSSKIQACKMFSKVASKDDSDGWIVVEEQKPAVPAETSQQAETLVPQAVVSEPLSITPGGETSTESNVTTEPAKLNIKELVQKLSREIAEELNQLSDSVAKIITGPEAEKVQEDLNNTSTLVYDIIKECNSCSDYALNQVKTCSDGAVAQVEKDSKMILDSVNFQSAAMSSMVAQFLQKEAQTTLIAKLSSDISASSTSLSTLTASKCISDAESIRDLVMGL